MKNNLLKLISSVITLFIAATSFAQKDNYPYPKQPSGEKQALPYDALRQADVFWEKRVIRVIDFREKMNLPFAYPGDPFIQNIYDLVIRGEITAYSPLYGDFKDEHAFTKGQVYDRNNRMDTLFIFDEVISTEKRIPVPVTFNYQDVKKLKIMEDWIFDEETSTMIVRIIGIAPVKERIDQETGESIGEEDMFWLFYPELRNFLPQYSVFNPQNGAGYFTFDDIFENRFFSSYIIKEDNVYDRYVNSYAAGVDEVLESERIDNQIFEFEHTVWEY